MVSLPWAEAPPCAPDENTGTEEQGERTVNGKKSLQYEEFGDSDLGHLRQPIRNLEERSISLQYMMSL